LEPGSRGGFCALVTARQPSPAAELGEGVLDPIERPDRDEAADACWWRLDVERDVLAGRELREAAIGAVADDRAQPSETGQALNRRTPDTVRPPPPPLGPDRGPGAVALGQVAPLAAGPADEQYRVDHLAARDDRRRPASTERIEEVGHQLPLLVAQGDREAHGPRMAVPRVSSCGTNAAIRTGGFRLHALSLIAIRRPDPGSR